MNYFMGKDRTKDIVVVLGIIVVGAIIIVSIIRDRIVQVPQWTVTVMGRGEVAYEPDEAIITLGVDIIRERSAERALEQLNSKIEAIQKALSDAGIRDESIKTRQYTIHPQFDYINERQQLAGYDASQYVAITVKDLSSDENVIGSIIEAATQAGANSVQSITFTATDIENLKQQARIIALQKARENGRQMSEAADVEFKRIVGWWENPIQGPETYQQYYYDGIGGYGGGGGVPNAVPTGENKIIIEIGLNYLVD